MLFFLVWNITEEDHSQSKAMKDCLLSVLDLQTAEGLTQSLK